LALPTVGRRATLAQVAADPVGVNTEFGHFTAFANLLDLSALSIPPNLTLYGAAWADESLLRLAESLTGSGSAGDGCDHVDQDLGATVRLRRLARLPSIRFVAAAGSAAGSAPTHAARVVPTVVNAAP